MSKNKNLLFFNLDGYPYNFEKDVDNIYKGSLNFDENSSDTYKTLGIYVFEEVNGFELSDNFKMNKMEIYNESGLTFVPFTSSGDTITNITKVNSANEFYSKWVIGVDLDVKYPKGSIVSFSGVSFNTYVNDFNEEYYTVIDNKPNAILINTKIENSDWDYTFSADTAKIYSNNIITINDYNDTLENEINSWTIHDNKKFTIFGTELNDGVKQFNSKTNSKTIYQSWDLTQFSGTTNDELKFDFELKTERPKLYQGEANFKISDNLAYITFNKRINSLINFEEGQQIIFEDYDDNPIMNSNPIFTIIDGSTDLSLFDGDIEFLKEININKTYIKHYDSDSLSSKNFIENVKKKDLIENPNLYKQQYPDNFFEWDYFLKITGTSENFEYDIERNDTIFLSASTYTSGVTKHMNNNRKLTILDIQKFRDLRIDYWKNIIRYNDSWYNDVKKNAIDNNRTFEQELELKAILQYNNVDNNVNSSDFIPLDLRYEKIKVKEYIIEEKQLNEYNIQKVLKSNQIRTIKCSMSTTLTNPLNFTKNVVVYNTKNILSFSQNILKLSSSDEKEYRDNRIKYWEEQIRNNVSWYQDIVNIASGTTISENVSFYNDTSNIISKVLYDQAVTQYNTYDTDFISYENTIKSFNTKYGDYLYDYGIIVFYKDNKIIVESIYSLNDNEIYFEPNIYLNDINMSGYTNIDSGLTNRILLNFDTQLYKEEILSNDYKNFDKNFYSEIYFDLNNNESNYGFNIELNDVNYYQTFSGNTKDTIISFINKYENVFDNQGFNLDSGTTIYQSNSTITYNYYESGYTTNIIDNNVSGYTLKITGKYSNVNVTSLNINVNLYSTYKVLNEIDNSYKIISGNEIEFVDSNKSFYDYGFSTGMLVKVSGSNYIDNNKSYNIIGLSESILELSYQNLFFNDTNILDLEIDTFLRKPRESSNKDIYYKWKFVKPYTKNIFYYDISGEHLTPYLNDERLKYIGPKPLWDTDDVCSDINKNITLIDKPNKNLNNVSDPTKQQTVFRGTDGSYCLSFLLPKYASNTEYNYIPEPLQVFFGFNSEIEGVSETTAVLEKVENIIYSGFTNSDTNNNGIDFEIDENGLLVITTNEINFNFRDFGFEEKQLISLDFVDQAKTGTTSFNNYGTYEISYVSNKLMKFNNKKLDLRYEIETFNDVIFNYFNTADIDSYFYFQIKVEPKRILELKLYGETEIEDDRFRIVLNNMGVQIDNEIEHIFKESDINEDGIDYIRLNRKRKEMLLNYPEIYNYIGSYKALINSINYFGWNDLKLNEYYKNINKNSPLFGKLQKVEIPDIFDNTIIGWSSNDYITGKYKNGNYKKTNLFNLTYQITDENGNNVLLYSLEEAQIKLNKLKKWLQENVLALSSNILDITGVAEVNNVNYQNYDVSNQITKLHSDNISDVVNFYFSETLNFQDNYIFELNFYTISNNVPSGWTCKIQTFSKNDDNKLINQKYFKLLKNDLDTFSFNIDKNIDQYIYIETTYYNDYGIAKTYNKLINTSNSKNYLLINNGFKMPTNYKYLNADNSYYWFDENGYIYLED